MTSPLSKQELTSILALTEKNGTDDNISTRSKIFQKLDVDVEDLSISALIRLIGGKSKSYGDQLFLDNACRSALTKMKFGPSCHGVIANKSYACHSKSRNKLRSMSNAKIIVTHWTYQEH